MVKSEALSILNLQDNFEYEELKSNYISSFITSYRKKSAAITMVEMESQQKVIHRINLAYGVLTDSEIIDKNALQFDFKEEAISPDSESEHVKENELFQDFILDLLNKKEHGLSIRLIELAILKYQKTGPLTIDFDPEMAYRLLGKTLLEIGVINQGMPYYNYGENNLQRGKSYMEIGDYRSALHFMGKELRNRETEVPFDEICQQISICYFLIGEYENALKIIEAVLPELVPKKQLFEESCKSKKFATVIMVCIYKLHNLEGSSFDTIKIWVKYSLSAKYLQNCYGKISEAYKIIEEFENDIVKYDDFLGSLKPNNPVREEVNSKYNVNQLNEAYMSLFNESLLKSLIYNPK